jgi:hypothetical protein
LFHDKKGDRFVLHEDGSVYPLIDQSGYADDQEDYPVGFAGVTRLEQISDEENQSVANVACCKECTDQEWLQWN